MKFHKVDDTDNYLCHYCSSNNLIEIGIIPVVFGWRVVAGIVNSCCYDLNYCAGSDPKIIEYLFNVVKSAIEQMDEDRFFSKDFPIQYIKPVFNDPDCFSNLLKMADLQDSYEYIQLPNLYELRKNYFEKFSFHE